MRRDLFSSFGEHIQVVKASQLYCMEYGDISDRTIGKPVNYLTKCSESRCAIQVRVEMWNTGKS